MTSTLLQRLRRGAILAAFGGGISSGFAAAPATPQGFLNFYTFAGDQRAGIQAGTAVPDGSYYPKRAEGPYAGFPGPDAGDDETTPPGDTRDNYNMVLKGYFYPPKDGNIQFAIATDDPGQLYFSTDENPANKTLVATESQWNAVRSFGGGDPTAPTRRNLITTGNPPIPRPENWSSFIAVQKGKPYYIEGVGTEFGGGDNLALAFRYDGDPEFADNDKPISGQYLSPLAVPAAPTIIGQPQDAAVYAGNNASFSVATDLPPPVTVTRYEWTKNGTAIPDSDAAKITIPATLAEDGAKIRVKITTSTGTLTSTEATLNVSSFTSEFALGVVKFEAWNNISSTAVSTLLEDPHYQDAPDDSRLLSAIDTPNGYAENYGARVSGFIIPAESGSYDFFIRSDDASQLYLSTSEKAPDPSTDTPIAEETGCCDAFHETGNGDPESTQAPIALVAGKKYAFLAFVKEGGGGDYLQVAMRKVGDPTPAGSLKPLGGTQIGANARPTKGEPQITQQPVLPAKMEEGQPWSVSVDGLVAPVGYGYPVLVQWQKNGADIPGANAKTLSIATVSKNDGGTYRAVLSAPSGKTATSVELNAVVIPDLVPPTLASAQKSFRSDTKVVVRFSEPVGAASANVAANYKINNGITVSAAAISSNPRIVELTTSAIAKGSKNQLTVTGVQDVFGNTIAAGAAIDIGFQKGVFLVTADPGPLTFAGDNAVNQHLIDRGFDVELARGEDVPDDGSTALGRDLIIETSSLGSGTVEVDGIGKFRTLTIPALNWEASSVDAFGFQEANANPGTTASQTQVNIVDNTHPIAAGFAKGLVTVSTAETFSQAQPVGAKIVGTLATDPTQAILFAYEKGDKGFNDFVMPERRVFFFFQDNTASVATDNGWKLFDASVNWLLRLETPAPPADQPTITVNRAGNTLTLSWAGGGKLQSASALGSPTVWADEAGASPASVNTSGAAKFYRVSR